MSKAGGASSVFALITISWLFGIPSAHADSSKEGRRIRPLDESSHYSTSPFELESALIEHAAATEAAVVRSPEIPATYLPFELVRTLGRMRDEADEASAARGKRFSDDIDGQTRWRIYTSGSNQEIGHRHALIEQVAIVVAN